MEFFTFASLLPVLQRLAGVLYPWQGIFDGLESVPVFSSIFLIVRFIVRMGLYYQKTETLQALFSFLLTGCE